MSDYVTRTVDPRYRHCYMKCFSSLSKAIDEFRLHRYNDCVASLYDVMEFFWKTLRFLRCGDMPKSHLPTRDIWDSFMPRLAARPTKGALITQGELVSLEGLFAKYNPAWKPNPEVRNDPRYGAIQCGDRVVQEQLEEIADLLPRILASVNRRLTLSTGMLTVGILNGYFGLDTKHEKPCDFRPYASYHGAGVAGWETSLRSCTDVKMSTQLLDVNRLEPHLGVVVNPFGEAYPERPIGSVIRPGYQMIKDYVFAGGVFVTAGGSPFHYSFDVETGEHSDTSVVVANVRLPSGTGPWTQVERQFIKMDFGVNVTMTDTPDHKAPCGVDGFQFDMDRRYWDCRIDISQITMFRALLPRLGGRSTPVVRATVASEEVYLVGFVRYGAGLLMHIGLEIEAEKEFAVATAAVTEGLVKNFEHYFIQVPPLKGHAERTEVWVF